MYKLRQILNKSSKFLAILGVLSGMFSFSIQAQAVDGVQSIAAIVNDQVISNFDVEQRLLLIFASAGVAPSQEEVERMRGQVLRNLIDEQLKLAEADKFEVPIYASEVDSAIGRMAAQSNLTGEQIKQVLKQAGIEEATLRRQVSSEIAWDTIVRGRFGSQIHVTDEEIDGVYNQTLENANKPQYLVSEIYLQVDNPDHDVEIRQTIDGLLKQLHAGAPFVALAQQFSQAASASQGGDIGWVQDGELASELDDVLRTMEPGSVSPVIRTLSGYYVLAVRNRRIIGGVDPMQTKLALRQWIFPLDPDAPVEQAQAAANYLYNISKRVRSCAGLDALHAEVQAGQLTQTMETIAANIPDQFRTAVLSTKEGRATGPFRDENGFNLIVICSSEEQTSPLPTREEISARLENQQVSMMARRYLRDLRNDAIVELR